MVKRQKYNQSENIGGLLGQGENSSITLSFATGNVLGRANVGGFIGLGNQMIITDAYASGDAMFCLKPKLPWWLCWIFAW